MKTFKVGDRVRVYATALSYTLETKGSITDILDDKRVKVELDEVSGLGNRWAVAHIKQCRRLIKKKKPHKVVMWAPVLEDCRQKPGNVPTWNVSDTIWRTKELAWLAKHDTCRVIAVVPVEVWMKGDDKSGK